MRLLIAVTPRNALAFVLMSFLDAPMNSALAPNKAAASFMFSSLRARLVPHMVKLTLLARKSVMRASVAAGLSEPCMFIKATPLVVLVSAAGKKIGRPH